MDSEGKTGENSINDKSEENSINDKSEGFEIFEESAKPEESPIPVQENFV